MRTMVWAVLFSSLILVAAAQSDIVAVPPWCSDNAVIESFTEPKGLFGKPRFTLLSVFSPTAADLEITSSLWPGKRIELDKAKSPPKPGWTGWEFNTKDLSLRQREVLGVGTKFEASFSHKARGQATPDLLHLTNLVMGQVWVLFVDPDHDSHDLPPLSVAARAQVRVLPLEGKSWTEMRGLWVSAAAAEQEEMPLFCGLPRSFANEMVKTGVNTHSEIPVGIILVSSRLQPPTSPEAIELFAPGVLDPKSGQLESAALISALEAARKSVNESRSRFSRAVERENARLTELKREGQVGGGLLLPPVWWRKIVAGDQADLPVRVSGVVW